MSSQDKKDKDVRERKGNHGFPPWIFRHKDLVDALDEAETLTTSSLINRINYLHFTMSCFFVHLRNRRYFTSVLLKAYPGPFLSPVLDCRWSEETPSRLNFSEYELLHLIIEDGQSMIVIPGTLESLTENGFLFRMTTQGFLVGKRQAKRFTGHKVSVELVQGGIVAKGQLMDFSPMGYRVRMNSDTSIVRKLFNLEAPVRIKIRYQEELILSANCRFIRKDNPNQQLEVVIEPINEEFSRYGKRPLRNPRQFLSPRPVLSFFHPLLKKQIRMVASDISTSGFSVHESPHESLLLQGMIIPSLTIEFFGELQLQCSAQVIYRLKEEDGSVRCGITILDMDVNSYSRLSHILYNALDPHAHVSQMVDLDELWEFLFESGFIYPIKYTLIQAHREEFKRTFKKLYIESPEIAKHITYQRHGRIEGHISIVRIYDKAWMIHHHAARKTNGRIAGVKVLKDLMLYLNDMHRLPSANMNYALCFYRPENKFPDRLFGGFARELKKSDACSIDLFTYFPSGTCCQKSHSPDGWTLRQCSDQDIWELNQFYSHHSGGLLLDILGLKSMETGAQELTSLYERYNLIRKLHVYSLCYENRLCAVLVLDQSDLGLNLSELTNSIKVIVIEKDTGILSWDILSIAVEELKSIYDTDKIPVLLYPHDYLDSQRITYEKQYCLWILDVQHGNAYMEFVAKKLRLKKSLESDDPRP